jgi:hypothetical protein
MFREPSRSLSDDRELLDDGTPHHLRLLEVRKVHAFNEPTDVVQRLDDVLEV